MNPKHFQFSVVFVVFFSFVEGQLLIDYKTGYIEVIHEASRKLLKHPIRKICKGRGMWIYYDEYNFNSNTTNVLLVEHEPRCYDLFGEIIGSARSIGEPPRYDPPSAAFFSKPKMGGSKTTFTRSISDFHGKIGSWVNYNSQIQIYEKRFYRGKSLCLPIKENFCVEEEKICYDFNFDQHLEDWDITTPRSIRKGCSS